MKREIITIGENGSVQVPATAVWMSTCEIADLIGAYSGKVNAQIKTIFKEEHFSWNRENAPLHNVSFMKLSDMGFIIVLAFYFQPLGTREFHQRGDVRTKRVYTHVLVFIYVTNYSAK